MFCVRLPPRLQAKAAKRYSDAIASFRKAVDIKANYPEAWNELGFALRQTGNYPEAIKAYDEAHPDAKDEEDDDDKDGK